MSFWTKLDGFLNDGTSQIGKWYNNIVHPYDREDTAYERNLQQTIFEREDNAVQRRVADLEMAGLSPVLAAGSAAGAGQPINARHEGANPLEAMQFALSMKQNMANLSRTKAEQERINLQNEIDIYNLDKAKELGVTTTAANSEWASIANAIFSFLGWSDPDGGGSPAPGDSGKIPLLSAMGTELSNLFSGNFTPTPRAKLSDDVAEAMVADFKNYNDYERAVKLRNGNPLSFDDWFNLRSYKYGNITTKKEMKKNYDSSSLPVATKGYVPPGWNGTR